MLAPRALHLRAPSVLQTTQHQINQLTQLQQCRSRLRGMETQEGNSSTVGQLEQSPSQENDPIVQWVVLRRDLWTDIGWPLGPVIAQACHASSAAMFLHIDDPLTQQYIAAENIDHMHKVGHHISITCRLLATRTSF